MFLCCPHAELVKRMEASRNVLGTTARSLLHGAAH